MTKLHFQRPRNPLRRNRVTIEFSEQGLTHQSFKDECDVNRIVDQYARTGLVPSANRLTPQYGENPESTLFDAACVAAELRSLEEEGVDLSPPENVDETATEAVSEDTRDEDVANILENGAPQAPTEDESRAE